MIEINEAHKAENWQMNEEYYLRGVVPYRVAERIPAVFDFIEYEWSEQAVWEAFLLHICWQYMPLGWHGGYSRADYIFDRSDLETLLSGGLLSLLKGTREKVAAYLDDESILPQVKLLSDREAEVQICYWNSWRGLTRESVLVRKEEGATTFQDINHETLVSYEIPLMF